MGRAAGSRLSGPLAEGISDGAILPAPRSALAAAPGMPDPAHELTQDFPEQHARSLWAEGPFCYIP